MGQWSGQDFPGRFHTGSRDTEPELAALRHLGTPKSKFGNGKDLQDHQIQPLTSPQAHLWNLHPADPAARAQTSGKKEAELTESFPGRFLVGDLCLDSDLCLALSFSLSLSLSFLSFSRSTSDSGESWGKKMGILNVEYFKVQLQFKEL